MSDSYQAIFDAVRSRISGGDVGSAVESAIRSAFEGADHAARMAAHEFQAAAQEMQRPSVLFKPTLSVDGNQYCALLGEDLQVGVAGFGDTPDKAMRDFDKIWHEPIGKGHFCDYR
jgi:hypothetical protein